jgi:integrase
MPRKAQWPPKIYQHPNGRDRVRIDGRDVWLGITGSEEARQAYARLVATLAANGGHLPPPASGGLTVADLVGRWWEGPGRDYEASAGAGNNESDQYRAAFRPLLRLYGDLSAAEFGPAQLEALQIAMATGSWQTPGELEQRWRRGEPADWCRTTANRRVSRVKLVWRWAERKGLVPEGRWAALCAVPGLRKGARGVRSTPRRKPTARADLDAVLPHCPPAVAAMLEIQWLVGMRSKEVRTMRTRDIDRTDPGCWVYTPSDDTGEASHKNAWRDADGGGEAPRRVPLGPECQRLLGPWLRPDDPDAFLFCPRKGRRGGDRYNAQTYAQAVRRACARASVAATRGQDLTVRERAAKRIKIIAYGGRHAAKDRITRELGADAARAVLGQRSIQTTSHYGSIDLGHAKDAARKIG